MTEIMLKREFIPNTPCLVNAGHNDYLQLIVETGLLGALAFLWFALVCARRFGQLVRTWQFDPFATLQMAATISCLGAIASAQP